MRRFGQIEFDKASRSLWVGGHPVALDRPCLAILTLLLDRGGEDVHKDRLLEAGWPGRVVHENSLAKAISRLRQAMGEDGRLLETAHGHGYRLAVAVDAPGKATETSSPASRFRRPAVVVAAAAGLLAAVILWVALAGDLQAGANQQLVRGEPADALGRILWVDDHPENNLQERRYFEGRKIAVYQVKTSEEALTLLAMYQYRAVISDMNRNGKLLDGFTLVREMRRRNDRTPFYLYTYVQSAAQRSILAQAGGQGVAVKANELYAAILPLFEKGRKPGET